MNPLGGIKGRHRVLTLEVPGRPVSRILCLMQKDASGDDAYYVLAECEGRALKWRSMIKDNAVRRLRDEYVNGITATEDVDSLDVETIFLCTTEVTKTQ